MKTFLTAILVLFTTAAFCQERPLPKNADGNYEYTGVISVDSLSASRLYSNGKLFVVTSFRSGKEVTQLNDEDSKTVAGNGTLKLNFKGLNAAVDEYVKFRFIIQCKDGRYKYTINNFQLVSPPSSPVPLENEKALKHYATRNMEEQIFNQVNDDMQNLVAELQKSMAAQSESTKDW